MLHAVGQPFCCSNCQRLLVFKTAENNCYICPGCQAKNFRLMLPENSAPTAGKVQEEMSIIQLGTTGKISDKPFEVIGRVQYFFQDSYRNHWQVLFTDNTIGWLGDWAGFFSFFLEINGRYTDRFKNAAPGKKIELQQTKYELEMMDEHRLTYAEGEIHDRHLKEDDFITLYLSRSSGEMALANIFKKKQPDTTKGEFTNTIETYAGYYLELSELHLQNTRNYDDWR